AFLMHEELCKNLVAFVAGHVLDEACHQTVDVESLASGDRMRAHNRMRGVRYSLAHLESAAARVGMVIVVDVHRTPAFDLASQIAWQCLVGVITAGEAGIPALAWNFHAVKHGRRAWLLLMTLVGVEMHL